jgi:signal peptidase
LPGITAVEPDHGTEPGVPLEGTPGSTVLPDDPWLAEWTPRTPGPTRLDEAEAWERSHKTALAGWARRGDLEVDPTPGASTSPGRVTGRRGRRHRQPDTESSRTHQEANEGLPSPPGLPDRLASAHVVPIEESGVPIPVPGSEGEPRGRRFRRSTRVVTYLVALALGGALWYFALGTLLVSRGAALVSGWQVTTIATGSMAPALNPGDLVAYSPVDTAELRVGEIIVFDSPVTPGTKMVHRLAGFTSDGALITKGDANEANDSTPVSTDSVVGVVKMVSPFGGYPTMLLSRGQHVELAALIALLLLAALAVHAPAPAGIDGRGRTRRRRPPT